ncbi:MAG: hypothetical protein LC685_00265 [Actinobacteria bacterium]|nr:hypothetical protein [Actinomycetota bacterium]
MILSLRRLIRLAVLAAALPVPIPVPIPIPIPIPTPPPAPSPSPSPSPSPVPSPGAAPAVPVAITVRIAPPGVDPNGPSGEPSLSENGRFVAFASEASNLGPVVGAHRMSNIYVFDFQTGRVSLISNNASGPLEDAPSTTPAISADGRVVAFASKATNLVRGTPKQKSDIFVRTGRGAVRLVSVAFGGRQPDGGSTQPSISADGRYVVFTSAADNLVAGDDNSESDIFIADLTTGAIRRVSVNSRGGQANGASVNPSISENGRYVSFTSTAANLVPHDRNHVADVFVHDMVTGSTRRVSVASNGHAQNASVGAPFSQVSSLDAAGQYVVFDSDATNLVRRDRNGHTDVFRHSLVTGQTWLVSQGLTSKQSDNDSFSPAISANGRVTTFESFADDLAAPWAPSENIFAQDFTTQAALNVDVTPQGTARRPELDAELLQRPAISGDGQLIAFTSGANNLVPGDYNGTDDLFVRAIIPPRTRFVIPPSAATSDRRPVVEFAGSNPLATFGLCTLDGKRRTCPVGKAFRLTRLLPGQHTLKVSVAAPGTLFDPVGATVSFTET